jgi:hypothetical protein
LVCSLIFMQWECCPSLVTKSHWRFLDEFQSTILLLCLRIRNVLLWAELPLEVVSSGNHARPQVPWALFHRFFVLHNENEYLPCISKVLNNSILYLVYAQ